jgi:hypothetical protein
MAMTRAHAANFALLVGALAVVGTGCSRSPTPEAARPTVAPPARPEAPGPCQAAALALHPAHATPLQGHLIVGMLLVNLSHRSCNAAGWPAVTLYTSAGAPVDISIVHGGSAFEDPRAATLVNLPPGDAVAFNVDFLGHGGPCALVQRMVVRYPASTLTSPLSSGGQSVRLCGPTAHEAAVYLPVFPAS